jgi:hypothetical protein
MMGVMYWYIYVYEECYGYTMWSVSLRSGVVIGKPEMTGVWYKEAMLYGGSAENLPRGTSPIKKAFHIVHLLTQNARRYISGPPNHHTYG